MDDLLAWEQQGDQLIGVGPDDWSVTVDPANGNYWVVWHRRDEWLDGVADSVEEAKAMADEALRESMMEYLEGFEDE